MEGIRSTRRQLARLCFDKGQPVHEATGLQPVLDVQQLFSLTVSTQKDMDDAGRNALYTALYGLETSTFQSFRDVARAHPGETDGAVRSYVLRTLGRARVDETLQMLARDRFQTVKVERISAVSFAAVKNAVTAQKPGDGP